MGRNGSLIGERRLVPGRWMDGASPSELELPAAVSPRRPSPSAEPDLGNVQPREESGVMPRRVYAVRMIPANLTDGVVGIGQNRNVRAPCSGLWIVTLRFGNVLFLNSHL